MPGRRATRLVIFWERGMVILEASFHVAQVEGARKAMQDHGGRPMSGISAAKPAAWVPSGTLGRAQ